MTAPAITIENLTKRYGEIEALSDLSLEVPQGSVFGFLGGNGAGKTTTMRILVGLCRPTSGGATVAGVPVTAAGKHLRQLGYLSQDPAFYGWMTGKETLEYVARLHRQPFDDRRLVDLLEVTSLIDVADRKTKTYSRGMRQRLGIAQALLGAPDVIILDEPVSALDPIGRGEVLELISRLGGDGTTVFFSTHILDDVQRVSNHVAILHQGRLIETAPTSELMGRFANGTVELTLSGANSSTATELRRLEGVAATRPIHRDGDAWTFEVNTHEGQTPLAQRAIAAYAVTQDLTLVSTYERRIDLDQIFVQLVSERST